VFISIPKFNRREDLPTVESISTLWTCGQEYLLSSWYGNPSGSITIKKVFKAYDNFSTLSTRMSW